MGHFKRIHQPSASGFLVPPAKRGERIKERGTRKHPAQSTNHLTSRKLSPTPPQPSPSIRIDGEGERDGGFNRVFKPFRASKEWAISSASNNPAPLVSSPRQRSAGRGLWRGELANIQCDQRTISLPENSVPPLPNPPHQSGLMEREKETVGSIEFLNHFEPRRNGPFQAHPPTRRLWFPRPASGARGEDYGEGEKQHWVCGGFYNLKRQGETCSKTEMRPEASLKSCLKIRKDAVLCPSRYGWARRGSIPHVGLRPGSNNARPAWARKPSAVALWAMAGQAGRRRFCPWALLSPPLQPATGMRRQLRLAQDQNPQSQHPPPF